MLFLVSNTILILIFTKVLYLGHFIDFSFYWFLLSIVFLYLGGQWDTGTMSSNPLNLGATTVSKKWRQWGHLIKMFFYCLYCPQKMETLKTSVITWIEWLLSTVSVSP